MPRTHSAAPHAHRYMVSSSLSSLAAAVLNQPSVEGLFATGLQPGVHRGGLGEISPMMCLLSVGSRRAIEWIVDSTHTGSLGERS